MVTRASLILSLCLMTSLGILSSCFIESKIEVTRLKKQLGKITEYQPVVDRSSFNASASQMTLDGRNLANVNEVRITGISGFDELYDIDTKTNKQLQISVRSNLAMLADQIYNIILTTAAGNTVFQTTFILSDMGASSGDILQYDGTNWNPIPFPLTGLNLIGTWDANANNPSLADSGANTNPSAGDYYIVETAGSTDIEGIIAWNSGDWIFFNGSTWSRINNTTGVSSFNGRSGGVSPTSGDYNWAQIANGAGVHFDYQPNNTACDNGDVLKYTIGTGWLCATDDNSAGAGDISDVIAGVGLTGGAVTGAATLNIDVGTGANQIVQLDGLGNLPSVNASALTSLNPANLSGPVAIAQGGTGAATALAARSALGLGTGAVANIGTAGIADIGTAAGNVMAANGVPVCLSTQKLQMSTGPAFTWSCVADLTGAGSSSFATLTDTPANFAGAGDQFLKVNAGATALEFVSLLDTNTSLGTSDIVAPTQNAVKAYVDNQLSGSSAGSLKDGDGNTQVQVEESAN
jgi:hypothetical protein